MKLLQLKRTLIIRSIIYIILLIGTTLLYGYLSADREAVTQKSDALKSDIADLNNKLTIFNRKIQDIREATKLWQRLNDKHKKSEGLRIDSIKKIFDDYKKQYKLSEATLDLSTPTELTDMYKTDTTVVVSSNVSVKFKVISDEYALSFVDAVMNNLPGYVKLEKLSLTRIGEITDETLLRVSRGEIPELVTGEITFQWRDLKNTTGKPLTNESSTADNKPPL